MYSLTYYPIKWKNPHKDTALNKAVQRLSDAVLYYKLKETGGWRQWDKNKNKHRKKYPAVEFKNGDMEWWLKGRRHRAFDKPAIITKKTQYWYTHGVLNRNKGLPAAITDIAQYWHVDGNLHRDDHLPAVEFYNGNKEYWYNGYQYFKEEEDNAKQIYILGRNDLKVLHSINDEAAVIYENGTKEWWTKGKLHRWKDLPAIEYPNGDKEWWYFGKKHRNNGPAIIQGNKKYWYSNGEFMGSE
jgi:hypothetical protein